MEFEDVSEQIEREMRRVGAAVGADELRLTRYEYAHVSPMKNVSYSATHAGYMGLWGESRVRVFIVAEGNSLQDTRIPVLQEIDIGDCHVYRRVIDSTNPELVWGPWDILDGPNFKAQPVFKEHMARTLYRLGVVVEDEEMLAPLNVSLTAHEKLELRLSLPREFWPQKWLDEEDA